MHKIKKKVNIWDKRIWSQFWVYFSIISGIVSFVFLFDFIPDNFKKYNIYLGIFLLLILMLIYLRLWFIANKLKKIELNIDGSSVIIKEGDLFEEKDFKVIAFNEFFDTQVDNKIISDISLNGIYINKYWANNTKILDAHIKKQCNQEDIIEKNVERKKGGKKIRYKLSSIVIYEDYLLTAFSKFDENNQARLTMPQYIEFLINFWDRVNRVYSQRSVSVPILGSGITRIKEHKNISDENLLKIMLWTFKISEYKFKYPAKLTIIINKDKIDKINLLDIKSIEKGL